MYFLDHEWVWKTTPKGYKYLESVERDKQSKEYIKAKAIYFTDSGSHNCKEPGPSLFRTLYTERPQRREAKRQLHNYMKNEEFVVILNPKNKLPYWT